MGRRLDANQITTIVVWALLLTAPLWIGSVGGYMSFGHAAFFGLGAYGAGFTLKLLAANTLLSLLLGTLLGGVMGAILGLLIVRRRGVYFAMVTIAFGQVFYFIAYRWNSLTGGDDGLRGFSRAPLHLGPITIDILNNAVTFYFFVLACFAVVTGIMGLLLRSPFGHTLLAIRENEQRARFLGIPIERHVWASFSLSCFFMSFAGALYALLNNFADPSNLFYVMSGNIVIMAVLGGIRAFWGPLIGAAVFVVLQDYLSSVTTNWMSFVGLLFVLVVLFFPRGLLGFVRSRGPQRDAAAS
jgi:branched-chain amino acid transport system permease protein